MSDVEEPLSDLNTILKQASEEMLKKNSDHCFTIDPKDVESNFNEDFYPFDKKDLEEYINYDMSEKEIEHLETFGNQITPTNHEDLLGDRSVLKILLDPG